MSDRADHLGSPPRASAAGDAVDGLLECATGALFLVLAAAWAANPGIVPIGAALAVVFGPSLLRRLREVVTYPRIGTLPGRTGESGGDVPGFVGVVFFVAGATVVFVVVIALTGDLGAAEDWRRWSGLLAGLVSAGGFLAAGEPSGLRRYPALAVTSAVVGFGSGVGSDGADYAAVGWYLLVMGALAAMLGLAELVVFVRRHPKQAP
ncbi:MAG: hypothetical protein OES24_10230 [Acidimicrobiia bacterium]|nr:hypothetical protein [Acidimicrobiia bacterium]